MGGRMRRTWGFGLGLLATAILAGCGHVGHAIRGGGVCPPGGDCPPGHPHAVSVCTDPTLMALGHDLDHLERHIDWYGSVVARTPDVWGQARLTEHRQEFEKQMFDDLGGFELNLQGSLARSDQAFFAHATALGLAAQPKAKAFSSVTSVKGEPPVLAPSAVTVETVKTEPAFIRAGKEVGSVVTTTNETLSPVTAPPAPTPPATVKADAAEKAGGLISDFKDDKIITRTTARLAGPVGFADKGSGLTLEPTLRLAQKKRYLDFLNQLRRENEGDDTADSPGYSLNLVRIPVSLLPGKRTDVGHGAEITMTLTPVLGDDLLPTTFRNLVANDLRHQLGLPLTQFLDDDKAAEAFLNEDARPVIRGLPWFNRIRSEFRKESPCLTCVITEIKQDGRLEDVKAVAKLLPSEQQEGLLALLENPAKEEEFFKKRKSEKFQDTKLDDSERARSSRLQMLVMGSLSDQSQFTMTGLGRVVNSIPLKIPVPALDYSPGLVNKTGFPTSQLLEVYGLSNCFQIAFAAHAALHESIARQKYAHLPDVQGFLQQEIIAAYRFLAEPAAMGLWTAYCTPEVVSAVRLRRVDQLEKMREEYRKCVAAITVFDQKERQNRPHIQPGEYSTTAALAWCILVDSALLTDKLVRDMGETASSKRAPVPGSGGWLDYYLPCPSPQARQAFNAYAALRWPVRVFALDPVTQDQNIADSFSSRRETQLALAIAFTNGVINANTMTRYARRLEMEAETVALNRTQVGFGHGENTFGWRFYPRYQTPETESNLTVLFRDQLIGGPSRNALLRDRRLEPGQRECVAVVMMPSFVPFVTLDTVGNWFGLANPKHKVLDHTQALKMSRTVQTLKTCGPNVTDAACYRTGEFERMLRRVEQLEARLPSQTVHFPVPVMNTLGGFEMFNNGTTDLAPELYGWYGAPGVKAGATTTLFLVGDHLSTLHTKVIVGNKPAGNPKLLSRQVMQVEVAGDAVQLNAKEVTAHLATPYGVSRELRIPVIGNPPVVRPGFTIGDQKLVAKYCVCEDGKLFRPISVPAGSGKLEIPWVSPGGVLTGQVKVKFAFKLAVGSDSYLLEGEVYGDMAANKVVVAAGAVDVLVEKLVDDVRRTRLLPLDPNPLATPLTSTKVTITPNPPGGFVAQPIDANDNIRLEFQPVPCPPGSPCPIPPVAPIPPAANGPPPAPTPALTPQPLGAPRVSAPQSPVGPPSAVIPK